MKQKIFLIVAAAALIITNSCKDNGTGPETLEPGRRDYVWTVDTIKAYYIYFNSLWGTTASDVWAVSGVGSVYENIYRYDGIKWYRETRTPIGNTVSLWGTENNLWICCKDGRIWKYNNDVFSSSPQFLYKGKEIDFFSMAGKSDNEVFAGGGKREPYSRDALLYKYNGSNWQLNNVLSNHGTIIRVKYCLADEKYFFQTYLDNITQKDTVTLFEYKGDNLKIVYQNYISENTDCLINDIDGYLYITIGKKIYRYYKNNFDLVIEIKDPNFGWQTWGRNKKDIFIRMFDGLIHYNGTDTQYILKFSSNITFGTSALVLEKDIFLHAFDNKTGYNIIYHGTLKEN